MPHAHFASNGVHGTSMCCELGRKDLTVLSDHGLSGLVVPKSACPHVDSVARLVEHIPNEQSEAICGDARLSGATHAALCAGSNPRGIKNFPSFS